MKKKITITAWAVVTRDDVTWKEGQILLPAGCDGLWRYPIFYTRKEARKFKNDEAWASGVIKVKITSL